jgi:hypothetical protein
LSAVKLLSISDEGIASLRSFAETGAAKLDPPAAREQLDAVLAAVHETEEPDQLQALVQMAQGLTPKLEAAAAYEFLDAILAAVRETTDPFWLQALAETAQGLTPKVEAAAARELLDAILAAVRETGDPVQLQPLVQAVMQLGIRQTDADRPELTSAWQRCVALSLEPDEAVIAIGAALLEQYEDTALVAIVADVMSYPTINQGPLGALVKILKHRFDELDRLESDKWEIASWIECRFPTLDLKMLPRRPGRSVASESGSLVASRRNFLGS